MIPISITYDGDLRCTAQHGPSGAVIVTDAPVDNHGKGEAFSPTDLTATSLGCCMATVMGIVAQRKSIDLKGMKIEVGKTMTASPPRRIARLEVTLHLPIPSDHPDRELLEATAHSCPVHRSLHPEIEQVVTFVYQ